MGMSEKQQTVNQLYVTATMFIPDVLPQKLTLAGIDDLFMRLGAEKAWLDKGHPRLWEGSKQQRVREWFEGITKFRPDLSFPIALNVLKVMADSNPALPAKERRLAIELAQKIERLLGLAPPPTPPHTFDHRIVAVARDAYAAGNYTDAVRRAYVEVINEVKKKAETPPGLDGVKLMNKAFSEKTSILKVSDDPAQQEGCMNLFKGAVSMIRNPPSHSNQVKLDKNEADELLWFATYLLRILDDSTMLTPQPGDPTV
jgi:uncharacterized protein (TIGR02391 family)